MYLSPTSLKMFYSDRQAFYCQYMSDLRPARPPQTQPMSVGSAFDAYVKSYLVGKLIGPDPNFDREFILKAQVESHNLEWAREAGQVVFDAYVKQGAMADILGDLQDCIGKPKFELTVQGIVSGQVGAVPFLGKPDIYFIAKQGARVITDWKVNGYCGRGNTSPKPGYVRIRTDDSENGRKHPKAMAMAHNGVIVSANYPLDGVEPDWAAQTTIYAWLLGEDIGSQFIAAIDQIACGYDDFGIRKFRIAQHRSIVNSKFQFELFEKAHIAWDAIQREHPFMELSKKENDDKCKLMDMIISTPVDPMFSEMMR